MLIDKELSKNIILGDVVHHYLLTFYCNQKNRQMSIKVTQKWFH